MTLPVAILAGGLATRLGPISQSTPKSLVSLAGRPFVLHQFDLLKAQGYREVVLCVGHMGERIRAVVGDGSLFGMTVCYSDEGARLLGTGGALIRALPLLGAAFFVLYGDSYLDCDYRDVEAAFRSGGRAALMTVFRNERRFDQSNILFDGSEILRYDKRHPTEEMKYIDFGLGVLSSRALAPYPRETFVDLATIYEDLIAKGEMSALEVRHRFYEIGTPESLAETEEHLQARRNDP